VTESLAFQLKRMSLDAWLFMLFVLLAIFEGALRKWWGFPTILLMATRDIIALTLVGRSVVFYRFRGMPNIYRALLLWSVVLVIYSFIQAMVNQTPPVILLIGWRFWLLYLWLALAVACSLTTDEMLGIANLMILLAIAMVPLALMQSVLPPSHILNTQQDTAVEKIFRLAGDMVRVSGTFSFVVGYACFIATVLPFAFVGKLQKIQILQTKYMPTLGLLSVFLLSLFSGSRGAIIWAAILYAVFTCIEFLVSGSKKAANKMFYLFVLAVIFYILLIVFFNENLAAYVERFESASKNENFIDRVLVIFIGDPAVLGNMNFLGHGFGVGSNAGAIFLTGEREFLLAESEPSRNLLEGGFIGFIWVIAKYMLGILTCVWATFLLKKTGDMLPLLLSITCLYAFGSWSVTGQISAQAFAYISLSYLLFTIKESSFRLKVVW